MDSITGLSISCNIYHGSIWLQKYAERGEELPIHSFAGWRARGYAVKKGETGIPARLRSKKTRRNRDTGEKENESMDAGEDAKREFYLTKCYLFEKSQTVPAEKGE